MRTRTDTTFTHAQYHMHIRSERITCRLSSYYRVTCIRRTLLSRLFSREPPVSLLPVWRSVHCSRSQRRHHSLRELRERLRRHPPIQLLPVSALDPTSRTHHQRLRANGNRDGRSRHASPSPRSSQPLWIAARSLRKGVGGAPRDENRSEELD